MTWCSKNLHSTGVTQQICLESTRTFDPTAKQHERRQALSITRGKKASQNQPMHYVQWGCRAKAWWNGKCNVISSVCVFAQAIREILYRSHRIQWSSVEMRLNVMCDFYKKATEPAHLRGGLSGVSIAQLLRLWRDWFCLLLATCPHRWQRSAGSGTVWVCCSGTLGLQVRPQR